MLFIMFAVLPSVAALLAVAVTLLALPLVWARLDRHESVCELGPDSDAWAASIESSLSARPTVRRASPTRWPGTTWGTAPMPRRRLAPRPRPTAPDTVRDGATPTLRCPTFFNPIVPIGGRWFLDVGECATGP